MRDLYADTASQRRQSDEPASVGDTVADAACNWLAYHPRWTTALICASIYLAFLADRWLP